jgi:hypothetical protein
MKGEAMGDEQGTTQVDPVTVAVDDELRRLINGAERPRYDSPLTGRRATVYGVLRTAVGIDRERWRLLAGVEPDVSEDPGERARVQAEQRERAEGAQQERAANLALIREHDPRYQECCVNCTQQRADTIRAGMVAPPLPDMPEPVTTHVVPEEEPEPERTCQCESCSDDTCQADCNACDDHSCAQCNCGPDAAYSCCGYCSECDSHAGDGDDERCNMGHCHECDHRCEDY